MIGVRAFAFHQGVQSAVVAAPKTGPPELLIELYFAGEGVDESRVTAIRERTRTSRVPGSKCISTSNIARV